MTSSPRRDLAMRRSTFKGPRTRPEPNCGLGTPLVRSVLALFGRWRRSRVPGVQAGGAGGFVAGRGKGATEL